MKIALYRHRQITEYLAEVDDDQESAVSRYRWSVFRAIGSKTVYARTNVGGKTVYLHRLVSGAGSNDEVDHIDGNGINNRSDNLRFVTRSENIKSASRLPGRYGNLTVQELDAELALFEAEN